MYAVVQAQNSGRHEHMLGNHMACSHLPRIPQIETISEAYQYAVGYCNAVVQEWRQEAGCRRAMHTWAGQM